MRGQTEQASAGIEAQAHHDVIKLLQARCEAMNWVRRGVCLLNAARFDEAAAAFGRARQLGCTDRSLPAYVAASFLGRGQAKAAAEQFARLAENVPTDTANRIRHALALWTGGCADEAVNALRAIVCDNPECAEVHFQLGTILAAIERYEEAELRFTQAISIDRTHAQALVGLALCCAVREAPHEAITHLQQAQVHRPHDANIGWLLANAARAAAQQGLAVRLKPVVVPHDDSEDRTGIEELSRIIEADPDFVDAFLSIRGDALEEGVFAMLLSTLRAALERQPEHAELHYHCGRVLDRLGRRGDAIDENEKAVALDPTFTRALIELGKLYHATDRAADATTRLEQAIKNGAEYADVYFLLGNLYRDQGRVGQAKSAYRRALTLNARYEAAQKALADLTA